MAYVEQTSNSPFSYDRLQQWAATSIPPMGRFTCVLTVISPIVFTLPTILGYIYDYEALKSIARLLLTISLSMSFSYTSKINKEKLGSEHTYAMLYVFKSCIFLIEERFSEKNLQTNKPIAQLSRLLDGLDSVSSILVSIPLNAFGSYHLHRYRALQMWEAIYSKEVLPWLEIVANTKVLCSLANFVYNYPHLVYPILNEAYRIASEAVGHPLIYEKERVTNDIALDEVHFVLLTGSNMSGKNTFLRTLGINIPLIQLGLPVCAKKADTHLLSLLVSMWLSDSSSDDKSHLFAEINRIEQIMAALKREHYMVLLDEILHGTNSEGKQCGTIGIIEQLLSLKVIGIVATHDTGVRRLSEQYSDRSVNKCFESDISEGALRFDYKLREDTC